MSKRNAVRHRKSGIGRNIGEETESKRDPWDKREQVRVERVRVETTDDGKRSGAEARKEQWKSGNRGARIAQKMHSRNSKVNK